MKLVWLALLTALAACSSSPVDNQVEWTKLACLDKASALYPAFKAIAEAADKSESVETDGNNTTSVQKGDFRIVSTGKFVWALSIDEPVGGKITCTGDFNRQVIETLNYNGLDRRPAANEVWKIG